MTRSHLKIYFIILLLNILYSHSYIYDIIQVTNHKDQLENKKYYLLIKNVIRHIIDEYTIVSLGYTLNHNCYLIDSNYTNELKRPNRCPLQYRNLLINGDTLLNCVRKVSDVEFHSYIKDHNSVPSIKVTVVNPDEMTRIELLINSVLQKETILYDIKFITACINPGVIKFKGKYLLATGLAWGIKEQDKQPTEIIEFCEITKNILPNKNSLHEKIGSNYEYKIKSSFAPLPGIENFYGQDPRIMKLNDDELLIVYTNIYSSHKRIGTAVISYVNSTDSFKLSNYVPEIQYKGLEDQKNWSPFMYKTNILFIQSINPLNVISIEYVQNSMKAKSKVFSFHEFVNDYWDYGILRGGSNCLYLKKYDRYLSFFHSKTLLPGQVQYNTYVFGAYTFSSNPPFKLLSISPIPILNEQLYTGKWNVIKNRKLDYIVFPMSIFFEDDSDESIINLSFGHQDAYGYLSKFMVNVLLDSMIPI